MEFCQPWLSLVDWLALLLDLTRACWLDSFRCRCGEFGTGVGMRQNSFSLFHNRLLIPPPSPLRPPTALFNLANIPARIGTGCCILIKMIHRNGKIVWRVAPYELLKSFIHRSPLRCAVFFVSVFRFVGSVGRLCCWGLHITPALIGDMSAVAV